MSLKNKFEEQKAIDNILEILEEMTPGSKYSQNMGHMVARNKQRTLQLKPFNYKKRTGYENREQSMPVGKAQPQQTPNQQPQQQVNKPNDPRVLRLAAELLRYSNQGNMAKEQIIMILNKALEKLGASL